MYLNKNMILNWFQYEFNLNDLILWCQISDVMKQPNEKPLFLVIKRRSNNESFNDRRLFLAANRQFGLEENFINSLVWSNPRDSKNKSKLNFTKTFGKNWHWLSVKLNKLWRNFKKMMSQKFPKTKSFSIFFDKIWK